MTVSLLISTYNWPEALSIVLESVKNQSVLPNEIIIADDGSRDETKVVIDNFRVKNNFIIHHIWQEDNGFRLSEIRNKAIAKAQFDYIIQIDGDVILNYNFIKNHIQFSKKNRFISGSRVLLSKKTSQLALEKKFIKFNLFSKKIRNRIKAFYFPFINWFIKSKTTPIEKLIFKVRGCNMSFWRQDLLDVNGYDEQFKTWGREDSELALRLLRKGLHFKKINFAAIQYHLDHNEQDKDNIETNNFILKNNKESNVFWCNNGIIK
jgi:glycosyltransferase involved in cell wall biosynthesis